MSATELVIFAMLCWVAEVFFLSSFLLFLGLGFVFTALLTFLDLIRVENIFTWQLFWIAFFSLIGVPLIKPILKKIQSKDVFVENQHLVPKKGDCAKIVENGMIECNGTMWQAQTDDFVSNEWVEIVGKKNKVYILKKIKNNEKQG